ncbi:MAG: hypothetical protein HFG66_05455 [Hungatella sp.]|nr:hypothetical protein [Hungatella sp.]
MEKKDSLAKFYRWKGEVLIAGALLAFAFFINRGIEIRGLFMDDLELWSRYQDLPFWKFMFPAGEDSFRFLYYILAYVQMALLGNHITWFVPCNIIINGLIAYTVFRFGRCVAKNVIIGFLCGILYLISRMSCFQISQVWGLMESVSLWMAVGILYCLYQYLNETKTQRPYFQIACGLYFGVCFVNGRYMVLAVILLAALGMKVDKKLRNWLLPVALLALVLLIRFLAAGSLIPAGPEGTGIFGGTDWVKAAGRGLQQILYLLGINTGAQGMCGLNWQASPRWVRVFVITANLWILVLTIVFLVKFFCDWIHWKSTLCNLCLFLLFIAACIVSNSVTEQIQLRQVYVSMTGFFIMLAYMCGVAARSKAKILPDYHSMLACTAVIILYSALMFPVENFYRKMYPNLNFWNGQHQANSLAEQTYEKYGNSLFGKKIYILENSYGLTEENAKTFFRTFSRGQKAESVEVIFADSIRDFGLIRNNMVILREEPKFHVYQDITSFVKDLKCDAVYGYYPDEWMGETAKIRVMAGETGNIQLQLMYPGAMTGEEISSIYQDGVLVREIQIEENITYVDLQTEPYNIVELDFENNFYSKNAYESSEGTRLAMMVRITAD